VRPRVGVDSRDNPVTVNVAVIVTADHAAGANLRSPCQNIPHNAVEIVQAVDIDEIQRTIGDVPRALEAWLADILDTVAKPRQTGPSGFKRLLHDFVRLSGESRPRINTGEMQRRVVREQVLRKAAVFNANLCAFCESYLTKQLRQRRPVALPRFMRQGIQFPLDVELVVNRRVYRVH